MFKPDREKALALLHAHNRSESLRSHALAVEATLRHIAREWGEDEDYWAEVGLLHDLDYEEHPDEHCKHSGELLRQAGYDDGFIHAVLSHGWGLCSDVKPELRMEMALYGADELCGLITACAYMRPSRSVMDLETPSVKKKFKTKGFAAGVDRDVIMNGCEMLGVSLDDLISMTIAGMRENAQAMGL